MFPELDGLASCSGPTSDHMTLLSLHYVPELNRFVFKVDYYME